MPGKIVGAVSGAIKILRYLNDTLEPVGVSRIAKDTGLNTSTSFNILRTLAVNDFVQFDPFSKTYALSLGIMEIAKGATALRGDTGSVRPLMERIAHKHGVTVTLWQPMYGDRKVLIMSALTRNLIRIQMAVGQRLPIYIGANGRVFAAFGNASQAKIRKRFEEIRWSRPFAFEAFLEQVRKTRERGWAMDDGQFVLGMTSLAVPILDSDGIATMAVTATMFSGQYNEDLFEEIVSDLKLFAEQARRIVSSPSHL